MTNKDWKRHMAYEALVILGLLALLTFICRLWPILLLIILEILIATLRLLFLSSKKVEVIQPQLARRSLPRPQRIRMYGIWPMLSYSDGSPSW